MTFLTGKWGNITVEDFNRFHTDSSSQMLFNVIWILFGNKLKSELFQFFFPSAQKRVAKFGNPSMESFQNYVENEGEWFVCLLY